MRAQVRHVQINMYDFTAVGFLLCMLMILYKFNNATAVHRGRGGGGGGGAVWGLTHGGTDLRILTNPLLGLMRRGVSSEVTDYI